MSDTIHSPDREATTRPYRWKRLVPDREALDIPDVFEILRFQLDWGLAEYGSHVIGDPVIRVLNRQEAAGEFVPADGALVVIDCAIAPLGGWRALPPLD